MKIVYHVLDTPSREKTRGKKKQEIRLKLKEEKRIVRNVKVKKKKK